MAQSFDSHQQRGVTLIEVLVTILILSIGLLGMAGLQSRLQMSEMEAYQRSQALLLLNDMSSRIAVNRNQAADYQTSTPLGAGSCPTATSTRQQVDSREWCLALQGAGETSGTSKVGAMVGGRGCVEQLASGDYMVTIAWQGMFRLSAPPAGVSCGLNSYDGDGCSDDQCRRVVTTVVRVADL